MFNSLKSDLYRIFKGKLCLISLLSISLFAIFLSFFSGDDQPALSSVKELLQVGGMLLPVFFTNIFVVTFGNEFTLRTINNSLIAGVSRIKSFFGKLLLALLLTTVFVSCFALVSSLATTFHTGDFTLVDTFKLVLMQLPIYFAITSLGVLCFNLIKTTYVAVAAFVTLGFVGEALLGNIITSYLPNLDFLIETFLFNNVSTMLHYTELSQKDLWTTLGSAILYTILAITISIYSLNKREFK